MEAELSRWRQGETVKPEEQVNIQEVADAVTPIVASVEGILKKFLILIEKFTKM